MGGIFFVKARQWESSYRTLPFFFFTGFAARSNEGQAPAENIAACPFLFWEDYLNAPSCREGARRSVLKLSGGQQRVAVARALASDAPFCWQMSRRVMRMAGIKVVLKESAQELKRRVIVVSHSTERQSKPARVQDKARQAGSRQPQKIAKQVSLSL